MVNIKTRKLDMNNPLSVDIKNPNRMPNTAGVGVEHKYTNLPGWYEICSLKPRKEYKQAHRRYDIDPESSKSYMYVAYTPNRILAWGPTPLDARLHVSDSDESNSIRVGYLPPSQWQPIRKSVDEMYPQPSQASARKRELYGRYLAAVKSNSINGVWGP